MFTVTKNEMKELERRANDAGLPYLQMMENAGRAAFDILTARLPGIKSAAIFCGTGNNGGDGLVVARLLRQRGAAVLIILVGGKPKTPDAITNLYLATMAGIPIVMGTHLDESDISFITSCDAVIDAIYGTGFHGELDLEAEVCCEVIAHSAGFKMALDLPSGLECDSGKTAQGTAKADITVTFHSAKPCHKISHGICGETVVADIGITDILR
ncbi:MAG: NAD(P)H-hydrate epimerase [Clostridia bacterium]|nr:NAD(P)H-hydrate epimerase [Clostridia bacterium]